MGADNTASVGGSERGEGGTVGQELSDWQGGGEGGSEGGWPQV